MKWPFPPFDEENGLPRHGMDRWFARRTKNLRFVNRLDPVWGAIALLLIIAVMLVIGIGGLLYPEPEKTVRVEDRRILQSFTDPDDCFVSAAPTANGQLLVSLSRAARCRSDIASGGVTLYDPIWRVFSPQTLPFADDEGYSLSDTIGNVANSVWIRGDQDGLARWTEGRWAVWASQTSMQIGERLSMDRDIVATAQTKNDGESMFATRTGAFSVYDTSDSRWQNYGYLPGTGTVSALEWSDKGVWVARGSGLWFADFSLGAGLGEPRQISRDPVLSLDLTEQGEAVVLYSKACEGQPSRVAVERGGCQALVRYTSDARRYYAMLDTTAAPRLLDSRAVQFVAAIGAELVLAGKNGIWRYNTTTRSWTRPEKRSVTVLETGPDGTIAYGGRGWIAMQAPLMRTTVTSSFPNQSRTSVMVSFDSRNRPLFTDNQGALIRLERSGTLAFLFEPTAPGAIESMFVASSPTHDYFIGESGQVALDRETRSYTRAGSNSQLSSMANATLYAQLGSLALGFVPTGTTDRGSLVVFDMSTPSLSVSRPVESAKGLTLATEAQAFFTDRLGRLFGGRINFRQPSGISVEGLMPAQPNTGPGERQVDDVTRLGDRFVLSGAWGIRIYNPVTRGWETVSSIDTRTVADLGQGGKILSVGKDGILRTYQPSSDRWLASTVIPNRPLAFNSERDILDTLVSPLGQIVFLAKTENGGVLQVYDPRTRRIVYTSNINAGAVTNGKILTFISGQNWMLRLGARAFTADGALPLAPASRGVVSGWAESGKVFVTVEQDQRTGLKFLHRRQIGNDRSTCLYRANTIDASPQLDAFMPSQNRLVTVTEQGVWLNNLSTRRWNKVNLPASSYQVGMSGNMLWARSTGRRAANLVYRIDPQAAPAYDSCDPNATGIASVAFENAVILPENGTVYRITSVQDGGSPQVVKETIGGRASVQLAPAGAPPGAGAPLRSFVHEATNSLWLAYPGALARYEFRARKWTQFPLPRSRDWSQVLIETGEGTLEGKLVASYIADAGWIQLRVPYGAGSASEMEVFDREIVNPGPVPGGRLAGNLQEIRQSASALYFRFPDRIVSMNRRNRSWNPAWPIADENAEMAIINNRFMVYAPSLNRLYFQRGRGTVGIGAALREVVVPEGQVPMIDRDGLISWIAADGALVSCSAAAICQNVVNPVPEIDLRGVSSIRQLGEDFLLAGDDGLGIVVTRDPDQRFRRLTQGAKPLTGQNTLGRLRTETIGVLRRSKNGENLFMASPSSGFWVVDGPMPPFLPTMNKATSFGLSGVFNPDDNLYIDTSKQLVGEDGIIGPLPAGISGQDIMAIGRFGDDYWFQTLDRIQVFSPDCISPDVVVDVPEDPEQDIEAPARCIERDFPTLEGQIIAYIEAGNSGQNFIAILQDGSAQSFDGRWQQIRPAFQLPLATIQDFLQATTFVRPDGKRSFFAPLSVEESVDGSRFTVVEPKPGGTNRRRSYVAFQAGTLAALDLGWLRFDAARKVLVLGRGEQKSEMPLDAAFNSDQRFLAFAWSAPAPQPDGTVIVALQDGQLRLQNPASQSSLVTAAYVRQRGILDAAVVPDTGGHWQGPRFLPFQAENTLLSPERLYQKEAFSILQDRRETGVRLRHGVNRVLDRAGFLWDRFNDIGLGPNLEVILQTALGPVEMDAPEAALFEGMVAWSADTLDVIEAATERRLPENKFEWRQDRRNGIASLTRDTLFSAIYANGTLSVSTLAGFGQRRGFGPVATLDNAADPVDLLLSRGDEPLVYGLLNGDVMIANEQSGLEIADPAIAAEVMQLEAWRVGPLFARAKNSGRTQFEVRLAETGGQESPAIGPSRRFLFDSFLQARFAPDQALYLVSNAGLMRSASRSPDLAGMELLSSNTGNRSYDLVTRENDLYVLARKHGRPVGCEQISESGQRQCDVQMPLLSMVQTTLSDDRGLTAKAGETGWVFSASDPDTSMNRRVSLENGRFSFDRIQAVAVCNGAFFMINRDGDVLRAPSATRWPQARFVERQPADSRLFCKSDRPIDPLPDGLWLQRPDGIWLNLPADGERFRRAAPEYGRLASQVFSIRASSRVSAIRRSDENGGLSQTGTRALQITQRFGAGALAPVTTVFSKGPALEIDTPTGFFGAGQRIWAITPDGIVDYGPEDRSVAYFTPERAPRVRLPAGCVVGSARRVSVSETELYCENGTMVRAGVTGGALSLSAPSFALATWTARSGQVSVSSDRQGIQHLALSGQKISPAITTGGFPFDSVRQVLIGGDGGYNLITGIGWWGFSSSGVSLAENGGNSIALQRSLLLRLGRPELVQAAEVNETLDPYGLCLASENSTVVDISITEDGYTAALSRNRVCEPYLGRDRLRSFHKTSDGRFFSRLWIGGQRNRIDSLVNGRFDSDRILELPNAQYISGEMEAGDGLCAPTALAGVSVWGNSTSQRGRVFSGACGPLLPIAPIYVDNNYFAVFSGALYRRE